VAAPHDMRTYIPVKTASQNSQQCYDLGAGFKEKNFVRQNAKYSLSDYRTNFSLAKIGIVGWKIIRRLSLKA
jgi:hypothetical protein